MSGAKRPKGLSCKQLPWLHVALLRSGVTPVQKVVQMLESMKEKGAKDMQEEPGARLFGSEGQTAAKQP